VRQKRRADRFIEEESSPGLSRRRAAGIGGVPSSRWTARRFKGGEAAKDWYVFVENRRRKGKVPKGEGKRKRIPVD